MEARTLVRAMLMTLGVGALVGLGVGTVARRRGAPHRWRGHHRHRGLHGTDQLVPAASPARRRGQHEQREEPKSSPRAGSAGVPSDNPVRDVHDLLARPDLSQFARSDQPVEPRCTGGYSRLTLTAAGSASGSLVVGRGISYPSVPHHAVAHVH